MKIPKTSLEKGRLEGRFFFALWGMSSMGLIWKGRRDLHDKGDGGYKGYAS